MGNCITINEFKERCNKIFNNFYDYSQITELHGIRNKVTVICPIHGAFEISAHHHLEGMGCKGCRNDSQKNTDWLNEANIVHNNKYDYSKYNYVNNKTKSIIICPKHGEFEMCMNAHLSKKNGCPKCAIEATKTKLSLDNEEFIQKSKQIYGDNEFNYNNINYVNNKTPIKLICNRCGNVFEQRPDNHLQGHGCPYCPKVISNWEQEIVDFLNDNNITVIQNNRDILNGKEIDIFLPQYNIGIECNGLYWHNELFKDRNYHLNKTNISKIKGIRLIHIFEDEWYNKKEIIKSILLNALHKNSHKIYARKCIIKEIDNQITKDFLIENHLQGYVNSKYRYGLYYNDELVSVMTFGNMRKNLGSQNIDGNFELLRFVNKCNYNVIGGANKLFMYFIKNVKPKHIISYCDKRLFNGNLYLKLGFEFKHISQPNYYYVINRERKNRFNFRKDILVKEGYDKNLTEHQIMLGRKIYRIYDCGCNVYEWAK